MRHGVGERVRETEIDRDRETQTERSKKKRKTHRHTHVDAGRPPTTPHEVADERQRRVVGRSPADWKACSDLVLCNRRGQHGKFVESVKRGGWLCARASRRQLPLASPHTTLARQLALLASAGSKTRCCCCCRWWRRWSWCVVEWSCSNEPESWPAVVPRHARC